MKGQYIPPTLEANAFNCAHCHVFAKQEWFYLQSSERSDGFGTCRFDDRFRTSYCENCGHPTIWSQDKLIYPIHSASEPPNEDLPEEICADYEEARTIASLSPRGAAALLRLAIQKLCKHLGKPGSNVNEDIKSLVATVSRLKFKRLSTVFVSLEMRLSIQAQLTGRTTVILLCGCSKL